MSEIKPHKKVICFIIVFLLFILLWGNYLSGFTVISNLHYKCITAEMNSVEATVTEVTAQQLNNSIRGSKLNRIDVVYVVDDVVYEQRLSMMVSRIFKTEEYSAGDKILIFYDVENPNEIEYPNDYERLDLYFVICLGALSVVAVVGVILDKVYSPDKSKKRKSKK